MTIVPFVLGTYGLTQLLARGLWTVVSGDYPAPVHGALVEALNPQAALGAEHAWLTIAVGAVLSAAYFLAMPGLLHAQLGIATLLLAPTEAERLAERVAELTATRAQASWPKPWNCAGSNATCTTAPRPGWSRSASPCAPCRACWTPTRKRYAR